MKDPAFNPDDLLFRLSQALDGELSESDRRELERSIEQDPHLRDDARKLSDLHKLLARWSAANPDVDWDAFAKSVERLAVTESEAEKLDRVDELLANWADTTPQLDWDEFTHDVMAELQPASRASTLYRNLLRIGMPLAAAAAIAIAFWGPFGNGGGSGPINQVALQTELSPVVQVRIGAPIETRPVAIASASRAVVSFSREPLTEPIVGCEESDISFIVFSSKPVGGSEASPL